MRKFVALFLASAFPLVSTYHASSSTEILFADLGDGRSSRESPLLETGRASKLVKPSSSDLKVVSYNIRWRSGDELRRLTGLLKHDSETSGAAILGLQEVDRRKKRSGFKNNAAIIAEALGMHYAWAAPPVVEHEQEEETGVEILSAYPLKDVRRLVLPHPGPGGRRRVALGATVSIAHTDIRVYSVHAETRLPLNCKLAQSKAVLADLACYPGDMPAIVLGDFNTWEPEAVSKTFELFTNANFHTPFDEQPTFLRRVLFVPVKLKLDWIWLRNLSATGYGIDKAITLSDHWPLWLAIRADTLLAGPVVARRIQNREP
ncbi:MAG TPA: endonuclease/exonuclease/phosphatase family protein [Pyrinomonadaceae bacterium]|jgi:endonuclease/exonuclease/phosphatase family metal-dependent hydrolase